MKTHENVPDNNVGRKTTEEIKNGLECCMGWEVNETNGENI